MGFKNNDALVSGATLINVIADASSNVFFAMSTTTFALDDGEIGDDVFLDFSKNNAVITRKPIFDFNGDGFISPGPNGIIDIDGTGPDLAGPDHIQVVSNDGGSIELRGLGSKGGQFTYADGATRKNLWAEFGEANVIEGTVGNDRINAADGAKVILHDNALGLNLGGDTISGFGNDDLLVTTMQLFDGNGDGTISFGRNRVLDMSGVSSANDANSHNALGGQLKFVNSALRSVDYLGSHEINGVTYYYYGTSESTYVVGSEPA
ncbi:hypothetical protein [Sphingomonas lacusdianchii]|uniref:hypothetical protein n=1 Tax=Sphingomonas lacusdianchii TaxID=2917992 RepID=UPI001F56902D|nr:hypothetical protein [Sphingomonas sp. JXJ CY 53]